MKKYTIWKRGMATVALLCLLCILSLSPVIGGIYHDCCGEECAVCISLSQSELLKSCLVLAAGSFFALFSVLNRCGRVCVSERNDASDTPVLLKVKLLN